jgi:hypothetical protein
MTAHDFYLAESLALVEEHTCDRCRGLGWLREKKACDAFAEACPSCLGRGLVTLRALARWLDVDPHTLARVWLGRAQAESAKSILRRLKTLPDAKLPQGFRTRLRESAVACIEIPLPARLRARKKAGFPRGDSPST